MTPVAARMRRLLAVAVGAIVVATSLAACANSSNFSDELACGELVVEEDLQVFVAGSCETEHTAERFFFFEAPFENYNSLDIELASSRYCLSRFLSHYDLSGSGGWGPGAFHCA